MWQRRNSKPERNSIGSVDSPDMEQTISATGRDIKSTHVPVDRAKEEERERKKDLRTKVGNFTWGEGGGVRRIASVVAKRE